MSDVVLTPQQKMAVENRGGALLVSAAAGSGKTRVLVDRVMGRLCDPDDPKNINDFLIITYTKAAAQELRGKIASAISAALAKKPEDRHLARQLSRIYLTQISTVHAFCANLLRDYAHELGLYPDFRIAEEAECVQWRQQALEQTLSDAYDALEGDPDCRAFLDQLGAGRDDRVAARILQQAYDGVQCHPDPEGWIRQCLSTLEPGQYADMADTPWGAHLMKEFKSTLKEQIDVLKRGIARLSEVAAAERSYGRVYEKNLEQLLFLDSANTWDEIYQRRITDFGRLSAVRGEDPETLERLKRPRKQCIDRIKKAQSVFCMPSDEAIQELRQGAPVIRGLFSLLRRFTDHYRAIKQRRRSLDFSDLEHEALRLLYRSDGALSAAAWEIRSRYCEVMVDEYQDSNAVQDRIFEAVSNDGLNLFMVGDVKQSIYRFRLADPGIFIEKYRIYRDAEHAAIGEPRRVTLSHNFRSRPQILSAVNDIFNLCMSSSVGGIDYGAAERLYPGIVPASVGSPCVELHCLDTEDKEEGDSRDALEARLAAKRIRALLDEGVPVREGEGLRPVRPQDIVILLRSMRAHAQAYLHALNQVGIEAVSDQSDDILQTTEISVLLSWLQILDNPHQDIPLLSVLLSPVGGFDADQVARVRGACPGGDFYDALVKYTDENGVFSDFLKIFDALREASRQEHVGTLVRMVCEQTGLRDVFSAMPDGAQRLENLRTIYQMSAAFDPDGPGRVHDFLAKIDRLRERGLTGAGTDNPNAVRIMSIHKSKGLEFPVVIVAGLSTKFNTDDERQAVQLHPELGTGCDVVDLKRRIKYPSIAKQAVLSRLRTERISEEMRVLYVALTRPKDLLIMTYASAHLASTLRDISDQLSPDGPVSLTKRAGCLGHWVLMAALRRGEAGALFDLGSTPEETVISHDPWTIRVWTPDMLPEGSEIAAEGHMRVPQLPADIEALISYEYPHQPATLAPAKLTATQFKGRNLDEESAEGSPAPRSVEYSLRQPRFLQGQRPLSPTEKGNAVHLAMQYIRYERCGSEKEIRQELERLVEEGFLQAQQAKAVAPKKILALFDSELGERILRAPKVVREFKFSILTDASVYDPSLAGEELLLQGVTDCCLLEEDGLCVIDYKTDRVRPGEEEKRAEYYRGQLDAYSLALSRIFERPVKQKCLYFFATDTAVYLD